MVDRRVLDKAEVRLDREYDLDFSFRLNCHPKGVEVQVYDNLPSIANERTEPHRFALFIVPLSRRPGVDEVVRRIDGGFSRYLGISTRDVYREGS